VLVFIVTPFFELLIFFISQRNVIIHIGGLWRQNLTLRR
jgi:hypothetical protein